ncbi:MAG: hypothetical protein ACE5HR_00250 [bacterium]
MTILSPRAERIFHQKYASNDEETKETWEQCVNRFCKLLTNDKSKQKQFFEFIYSLNGLPGGRALSNAGTTNQILNCFVLPIEDNIESISKTLTDFIKIETLGGGVGINFSNLRAKGAPIYRKGKVAKPKERSCGPIGFMDIFHKSADVITGIGERKGATAAVLDFRHPDAYEFIKVKRDHSKWNSFNISLGIDDCFINNVKSGVERESKLWNAVIDGMIKDGEPGLLNLGTYAKYNTVRYLKGGEINCCNPCFELGLQDYSGCCLFSINLSTLPNIRSSYFYDELKRYVYVSVEIANYMLEKNNYIIPENKKVAFDFRRVGVGVFGLAHFLIKNNVKYGSSESLEVAAKLFEAFRNFSYEASANLTKVFGKFKGFNSKKYLNNPFFEDFPKDILRLIRKKGMANCAVNTCAPTGTLSQLANTSSGVEPIFELSYIRKDSLGEHEIKDSLYETGKYPKELFATTNEITPKEHIAVQRTIQKYLDGSISKTINCMPDKNLHDKLSKLLLENIPYLKGVTVYVKGSREVEVLSSKSKLPSPDILPGFRRKHKLRDKTIYVATYHSPETLLPLEVWLSTGEVVDVSDTEDFLARLLSKSLQWGLPVEEIIYQARKVKNRHINSLSHIIANRLEAYLVRDGEKCNRENCGGTIIRSEGCKICLKCSHSICE